jgi:hypothetical protein
VRIKASEIGLAVLGAVLGACGRPDGQDTSAGRTKAAEGVARPNRRAVVPETGPRVLTLDYSRRVQGPLDWSHQQSPAIVYAAGDYLDDFYKLAERKATVQLVQVALPNSIAVRFTESPTNDAETDPAAIVECAGRQQRYEVGELANDRSLHLAYLAVVPLEAGAGMLVAGYAAGATGAVQGYALLHYTPSECELRTLPLLSYGRVAVSLRKPDRLVVWSVHDRGWRTANDPVQYATRTCLWGQRALKCSRPRSQDGTFVPNEMNDPPVEIEGYKTRICYLEEDRSLSCYMVNHERYRGK